MEKLKSLAVLVSVATLSLLLTACGGDKGDGMESSSAPASEEPSMMEQAQDAADEAMDSAADMAEPAGDAMEEMTEEAGEAMDEAMDSMDESAEDTGEAMEETMDSMKEE